MVLNWSRGGDRLTQIAPVTLSDRIDLLSVIMNSPGPFYQRTGGGFEPKGNTPDPTAYLDAVQGVRVCEVFGRIDLDAIVSAGRDLFHG
ncbi:hypothetical protein J4E08_06920 [Sagittula sp. NFXS13]|uniref:hypothetical protein n=1 Tax=Sagittula sp. NFXS13 TaxID=2819095 RepID=UPI0032DEACD5